jgi:hypothetical protein
MPVPAHFPHAGIDGVPHPRSTNLIGGGLEDSRGELSSHLLSKVEEQEGELKAASLCAFWPR